jgi:hypothetical protein
MAKEFRYLRILIVKTVIDQRFCQIRDSHQHYTHGIGQDSAPIQHYFNIADACVFGKQLCLSILCHHEPNRPWSSLLSSVRM